MGKTIGRHGSALVKDGVFLPFLGFFEKKITYNPRFYFGCFVLANFLLAYSHLNLPFKIWIGCIGILLPLALAMLTSRNSYPKGHPSWALDLLDPPSGWLWGGAFGLAVFLRFNELVSLPAWPMWDDALHSFFCIQQIEHWDWHLWYTAEKQGPLSYWLDSIFYKAFTPSLFSMWFWQALQSAAAPLAGYWACRQFFPKSLSLVFSLILAFGFLPLYLGQFCSGENWVVLWEYLCLALFGLYLKSIYSRQVWALLLGLYLALGVYISVVTLSVTFILIAGFTAAWYRQHPREFKTLTAFGFPLFLLSLPVANEIFKSISSGHISTYLLVNRPNPLSGQLAVSLSYLTVFTWGTFDKSYFNFGPLWGGYFNPLLGAAFLLGVVELFRFRQRPVFYGAIGVFLTGLLPGILSNTLEMMRIMAVFPLCFALVAVGLLGFLAPFPHNKRGLVLALVFACSLPLDLYHLWGPYHRWAVPGAHSNGSKSAERYRACQILDQVQAKEGPGLILTEFVPDIFDQSLLIATYPFNAARNPALDPQKARWAAVLADDSFRFYFARHFLRSQIYPLFDGLSAVEGNLVLFLIPLAEPSRPVVQGWMEAHRRIQGLFALMPYHVANPDYVPVLKKLESYKDDFKKDPFLESCYWEKLASLEEKEPGEWEEVIHSLREEIRACGTDSSLKKRESHFWEKLSEEEQFFRHDDHQALQAMYRALKTGDPSPVIYKKIAKLEIDVKNYRRALWAVQQAWKLAPQDPPPLDLLRWLKDQMIPGRRPEKLRPF